MDSEHSQHQAINGARNGDELKRIRVVCFGDSVMWGQGLPAEQKYGFLVWEALAHARNLAGAAARRPLVGEFAMRAHAGAVIGMQEHGRHKESARRPSVLERAFGVRPVPDWLRATLGGEIADAAPTIVEQVDAFDDAPQQVDLVLVNGGGNDIGALWYMRPTTSLSELKQRIERYCFADLSQLLLAIAERFPNACIVVPGYMQSFGPETQKGLGGAVAGPALRAISWLWQPALDRVFERNRFFREETARQFERAVAQAAGAVQQLDRRLGRDDARRSRLDEGSAALPDVRVLFADVGQFRPENVANGPAAWVWGIDAARLTPQDPMREFRLGACARLPHWSPWYWSSLGHPNALGAGEIADGILRRLHSWSRENASPRFAAMRVATARAAARTGAGNKGR